MNEALLHELAVHVGGRFRLTSLVQRRLVELMAKKDDIVAKNCGGRPIRLVVEMLDREMLHIPAEGEAPKELEAAGKEA